MIRPCTDDDLPAIERIINEAAEAYRDAIPRDLWREPYMPADELLADVSAGVAFSGWDRGGELLGVMGLQRVRDATLIRHAYVRPAHQGRRIGSALLEHLLARRTGPVLVGTWAAARWAIRFYERHGFQLVPADSTDDLLQRYWNVPARQRQASVVLVHGPTSR